MTTSPEAAGLRIPIPVVLIFSLLQSFGPCAQAPAANPTPARDAGWPCQVTKDGAQLVYYQSQLEDWKDFNKLTCRMAFTLTPVGPICGRPWWPGEWRVVRTNNGVHAGNDGNVYRKDSGGGWSKYSYGDWSSVDTWAAKQTASQNLQNNVRALTSGSRPVGAPHTRTSIQPDTLSELDRSAQVRQRGQMQTQRYQSFHRAGGGRFRR